MKNLSNAAGKVVNEFIENLGQGTIMESNKAINSLFGGGEYLAKLLSKEPDIAKNAFQSTFKNTTDGSLNLGKMAGSYIGASTAYRVASGGGAYRDKNGNNNIIGVPFV